MWIHWYLIALPLFARAFKGSLYSYPVSYYHEPYRNLILLRPMTLSQVCLKATSRFKLQGGEGENIHRCTHTAHGLVTSCSWKQGQNLPCL